MSPTLQLISVSLRVHRLAKSLDFYVRQLGFHAATQGRDFARLSASRGSPEILTLIEDQHALPAPKTAAGLFHAALLFPTRAALGGWLRHALSQGVAFDGFSDHHVSEALYFSDPDGNGLEFYRDRPRSEWAFASNGEVAMATEPLDVDSLLAESSAPTGGPLRDARWGHLHLRVTNLDRSSAFYLPTLGTVVTQSTYPGARFLAADGYHHHLGLNTWGRPQTSQPPGALGLIEATFTRRGQKAEAITRDPDGIGLRLQPL